MTTGTATASPRRPPRAGVNGAEVAPVFELADGGPGLADGGPALGQGFVRRPGLTHHLASAREAALALIIAPAGYGKSTLLAEWEQRDTRPFVWLAFREGAPEAISAATSRKPGPEEALSRLIREAHTRHDQFVLVLDDGHLIDPVLLRAALGAGLKALPPGSTIALASRTEPAIPIGRLRANRRLSEIRTPQLAMSSAEAATLLNQVGRGLDLEDAQALVARTEGWPAALYLAALAMGTEPTDAGGFGGHNHLLREYLRDEVLDALSPELVTFAVRTAVLDELSGRICDAVLERHGSARVLERLARATPLVIPLDSSHSTFRWHTLMREVLLAELRLLEPELEHVLRLRAFERYAACGDTERAIDQTAAAEDAKLTGDLLWQNILMFVTRGRHDLVRRWLGNFTADRITDNAPLAMSASFSALMSGNLSDARHWSLTASAAVKRRNGRAAPRSLATGIAVIEAMAAEDGLGPMAETAGRAVESEPGDSPWRPMCLFLEAIALHLGGNRTAAEHTLDDAIRLSGNAAPTLTSLCLAQRAMIAIEREQWQLATELTDRGLTLVETCGLMTDPLAAIVFATAAASRAHDGRIDEAKRDLRNGIDLLAELGDFVSWYGAEARILLAHAALSLADIVRARTLLAEASRFARRTPGATIFSDWFDHAWAYMDTLAEMSLAGPSSLTIAELRILRFLPSHRSFREIGAQLGVSANTVKTQAHAVYRKLGAASRSEAVAQAMEAGLLGR